MRPEPYSWSVDQHEMRRPADAGELADRLAAVLAPGQVFTEGEKFEAALHDGTAFQGLTGRALVLVEPDDAAEVAAVMRYAYEAEVPIFTRGGGTGLAGGAVPEGGIVLSLARLNRVRSIDPGQWRMEAEAGVTTATVHRIALENGLMFPPDPGAGEQSTIGGNVATNAGGPHALRYGVTNHSVTGLEVVIPPGRLVHVGGTVTKNVAGLDLKSLMVGSEGTLGIVTAVQLRLVPAPEARGVTVATYSDNASGCTGVEAVLAAGIRATALEFLDRGALTASVGSLPFDVPADPGFMVIAEADGSAEEVRETLAGFEEALGPGSASTRTLVSRHETDAFWSWREGVSWAVAAQRGGKVSEDIVVPVERLAEAVEGTLEIGHRHGLEACSWGHAGDGNLHSSFLVDLEDPDELARAREATGNLFDMALALGGSISGEHGVGTIKTPWVDAALGPEVASLQVRIKQAFDPKLLLNPGHKIPLPGA
jgi:glycolate oxidase subunit GlcD